MGTYLPDSISQLTKDKWKKARSEAGFDATLFGGPAVGSKLEEFKKIRDKCKPLGDKTDIKKVAQYISAAKALQKALLDYHDKAMKENKKQNVLFAKELKGLADKMQKKIDKGSKQYQELAKLWDKATDGDFTKRQAAVENLYAELNM